MKKLALLSFVLLLIFACTCFVGCEGGTEPPEGEPPVGPTVAVTGVSLNKQNADLDLGATLALSATVAPDNATNKGVSWSSSDTTVASVVDGTVTAIGEGTAVITVTTADGSFTASCTVRVHVTPTVSFYLDGELYYSYQITDSAGSVVPLPQKPADVTDNAELSLYFSGWYLDEGLLVPFDASKLFSSSASVYAYMADFSSDALSYRYDSTYRHYYITGFAGESLPFLVIPSSIDGNEIYGIDDKAFALDTNIRRVLVIDGVKKIGDKAFERCSRLTTLTLPDSIKNLCEYAFAYCYSLLAVRLPAGLTTVESRVFSNCTSLQELIIPETVQMISFNMFEYCSSLRNVTFPEGLEEIENWAFSYCTSLEAAVLPSTLSDIGNNAFTGCKNLLTVTLSRNAINMGSSAFSSCDRLVEVIDKNGYFNKFNAPDGGMRTNCLGLHSGETRLVTDENGFVFYSDGGKAYLVAYRGNEASVVLPADFNGRTYEINENAFADNTNVLSVTIPAGVTKIGDKAFYNCSNLIEVINLSSLEFAVGATSSGYVAYEAMEVHDGASKLVTVGDFTFYNRENEKTLVRYNGNARVIALPESADAAGYHVGKNLFKGNQSIVAVVIPEGVRSIGAYAFNDCQSLVSVSLPSTLESIHSNAFFGYKLVEVIDNTALGITAGSSDFGNVARYAKVVHKGESLIKAVGDYLFLTDGGVNYLIGYMGTSGDLVLPSDYQGASYEILPYAFYQRYDIYSVKIPSGVTAIGSNAFQYCNRLASVELGSDLVKIGNSAFSACYALSKITIPAAVTEIGSYAFYSCDNLTEATFEIKTGWKVPSEYGPFTVNESLLKTVYSAATTLKKTGNNGYADRVWTRS